MRGLFSNAGATLFELLVTVSVIGVLLGVSVLGIRGTYFDFATSKQRVVNDLRLTRSNANTKGAHFRVLFGSGSYFIERLQDEDGDGVWDSDPELEPQEINLPDGVGVTLSLFGGGGTDASAVEFDTRGMVVPPDGKMVADLTEIIIRDLKTGEAVVVQVWPSGQVQLSSNTNVSS